MRAKKEILRDMGVNEQHNPHAGVLPDTKEVILVEVLIDIRDILNRIYNGFITAAAAEVELEEMRGKKD